MNYLDDLKPGQRENAYYIKSNISGYDRLGIPSSENKKFYVYVWDPALKKHIGKFVERNQYDFLG